MRKYDPTIHHRRSVRLRGYDYSQLGAYFVTICTQGRRCMFGEVIQQEMHLNDFGQAAYQAWEALPERWKHIELAPFQIMPNHMHGILLFHQVDTTGADLTNPKVKWALQPTLGDVVGAYCSIVQNECLRLWKDLFPQEQMGKVFQRNFHEHIIRHVRAFDFISNYIITNPANWEKDKFFLNE
jgi:putative transposase